MRRGKKPNNSAKRILKGKTIAVLGFGSQGEAQAQCMRDSGLRVIVGVRSGKSATKARKAGFKVLGIKEAAKRADIIHLLLPDEAHKSAWKDIAPSLTKGKTLSLAHGYSLHFKTIVPPKGVDVMVVSPRGPGPAIRELFVKGSGALCSIAIHQNATGEARKRAYALAESCGLTRVLALECTVEQETIGDLFAEQAVLVGGASELIKAAFETLVKSGYPPKMAYLDCLHELKLVTDLMQRQGIDGMYAKVSNTAEFGARKNAPRIIDADVKARMKKILSEIKEGKFSKEWDADVAHGYRTLKRLRKKGAHKIDKVGRKLRKRIFSER